MANKYRINRTDISDAQRATARLIVLHPTWSKDRIAEVAGVSRTTLYGWLRDSRFLSLLDSTAADPKPPLITPTDILNRLDPEAKRELLSHLENTKRLRPDRATRIDEMIARLRRRLDSSLGSRRKLIEHEMEKLIGRLKLLSDTHASRFYGQDGMLKAPTAELFDDLGDDLEELAILERALCGTDLDEAMIPARISWVIAAGLRLGLPASELLA